MDEALMVGVGIPHRAVLGPKLGVKNDIRAAANCQNDTQDNHHPKAGNSVCVKEVFYPSKTREYNRLSGSFRSSLFTLSTHFLISTICQPGLTGKLNDVPFCTD